MVNIATMKPPIIEPKSSPTPIWPSLMAFHDNAAVADKMARSASALTMVPCTVIVVLRGTPYTCSYPANISWENAGLLVATVNTPQEIDFLATVQLKRERRAPVAAIRNS